MSDDNSGQPGSGIISGQRETIDQLRAQLANITEQRDEAVGLLREGAEAKAENGELLVMLERCVTALGAMPADKIKRGAKNAWIDAWFDAKALLANYKGEKR